MEAYSLFDLNQYINRVLTLNFDEPIWIHAEISQIKENRGQYYIDLIEKDEDTLEIKAQSQAVIWYKTVLFLRNKLKSILSSLLQEGVKVKIKVSITFHEKFGLKLEILDIDPSFTIGLLEIERQNILERLRSENLVDINARLPLPQVIQRIAIISSSTAAGYIDFIEHMRSNNYGYSFHTVLYNSRMQGKAVESEVVNAFKEIETSKAKFDIVIIIRGGGSKLDLSDFDNYNIAASIAHCCYPVLTGIGHDIDSTIADIVSHSKLKTPTAVADKIIDHNLSFESAILNMGQNIHRFAKMRIEVIQEELNKINHVIYNSSKLLLEKHENILAQKYQLLRLLSHQQISNNLNEISQKEVKLDLINPLKVMERGYAFISQGDNKIITSKSLIDKKQALKINMQDGTLSATVT